MFTEKITKHLGEKNNFSKTFKVKLIYFNHCGWKIVLLSQYPDLFVLNFKRFNNHSKKMVCVVPVLEMKISISNLLKPMKVV